MRKAVRILQQKVLGGAEKVMLRGRAESIRPSLFILGLPRSGTTLLYQYIVHRLDVAYFTNGVEQYYYAPTITTRWRLTRYGRYASDFNNQYGKVEGHNAPHEAGNFWGQFFGFQDYKTHADVSAKDERRMRRTVATVEEIFGGKPFVTKNVKHLLRLDSLSKIFPKAHFLVIHRDLKDVALSLLRGRYANLGRADQWWSVRPPDWKKLDGLLPAEQIARQVMNLRDRLLNDLEMLPSHRVHSVQYDDFCQEPEILIGQLRQVLRPVAFLNKPVEQFSVMTNNAEDEEEIHLLGSLHTLQQD